jgi:hypothetical protein
MKRPWKFLTVGKSKPIPLELDIIVGVAFAGIFLMIIQTHKENK